MKRTFPLLLALLLVIPVVATNEATARSDPYEGIVTSVSPESGWIGIDDQLYRVAPDAILEDSGGNVVELSEFRGGTRIIYSVAPSNEHGDSWIVRLRRVSPEKMR